MPTAKLFIPTIGEEITLASDWEFTLYSERRNSKLWKTSGAQPEWKTLTWKQTYTEPLEETLVLPAGTVLRVARIYIKQRQEKFDSLTFTIASCPSIALKGRFWAKLSDCRNMEIAL